MKKTFDIDIYTKYASKKSPKELSSNIYVGHTERTLTIFEPYPKAMFHLLMLPRVGVPPLVPHNLKNLRTLLTAEEVTKSEARALLLAMKDDAEGIKRWVENKMFVKKGFKWNVWMGFHAFPSMNHLHLHIISGELVAEGLKEPKHYNAFHPELGYFLHLDDVLEWFEAVDSRYDDNIQWLRDLQPRRRSGSSTPETSGSSQEKERSYNDLLKAQFDCFYEHCLVEPPNMPAMKLHLQEHWDKFIDAEVKRIEERKKNEEFIDQMRRRRAELAARREKELEGETRENRQGQTGDQSQVVADDQDDKD